ncbi:MAG TPA: plastocyanin/azurin family copper-binding protein [Solirubrobacterales bacterium]|nr:plastocyanin/azurin family copper-binding protein [Solirubrobacterales bacterium]
MSARRSLLVAAVAAALCGLVAGGPSATAGGKTAAKPKLVSVADFYFGPDQVTIKRGDAVKWVWATSNTYPHDVHLKQGPKGLQHKGSYSTRTTAVTNARFRRTFETPGTYRFICTIHPTQMKLTVTVLKGKGGS